jgi:hypothetical protein
LGPAENADDDLVEHWAGAEEETAVDGAAGDLDESTAFGDKTQFSHTPIRRKIGGYLANPCQA